MWKYCWNLLFISELTYLIKMCHKNIFNLVALLSPKISKHTLKKKMSRIQINRTWKNQSTKKMAFQIKRTGPHWTMNCRNKSKLLKSFNLSRIFFVLLIFSYFFRVEKEKFEKAEIIEWINKFILKILLRYFCNNKYSKYDIFYIFFFKNLAIIFSR